MKEIRFFYVPNASEHTQLPPDEASHALRVLRLAPGDTVTLIDGKGFFHKAEISLTTKRECFYSILESLPQTKTWRGHIHLAIAPTKMMERMEWLSEKAVEVGLDELTFLNCRFSERTHLRADRIEKIIISAMKQSRKPYLTTNNGMVSFSEFISTPRPGRKFICHCYSEIPRSDLFTLLSDSQQDGEYPSDITVLVGPEGDFSIDEVRKAMDAGYESVTLGESRLRTETAGLMAVAMANIAQRV
ncbi:MAG: RsmE family RNA methyltransferase [Prevotella sp.]